MQSLLPGTAGVSVQAVGCEPPHTRQLEHLRVYAANVSFIAKPELACCGGCLDAVRLPADPAECCAGVSRHTGRRATELAPPAQSDAMSCMSPAESLWARYTRPIALTCDAERQRSPWRLEQTNPTPSSYPELVVTAAVGPHRVPERVPHDVLRLRGAASTPREEAHAHQLRPLPPSRPSTPQTSPVAVGWPRQDLHSCGSTFVILHDTSWECNAP